MSAIGEWRGARKCVSALYEAFRRSNDPEEKKILLKVAELYEEEEEDALFYAKQEALRAADEDFNQRFGSGREDPECEDEEGDGDEE